MRNIPAAIGCWLLLLTLIALAAQAENYNFTRIADTTGQFSSFSSASINANGLVTFLANRSDGGQGIYVGSGGSLTTIVDSSGQFSQFSSPRINKNGTVAFFARVDSGEEGIFTGTGGPLTTVVETSTGEFDGLRNPNISDNGTIVFHGTLPRDPITTIRHNGIFTSFGGTVTTVADTSGSISHFQTPRPVINANGTVAFTALLDTSEVGIFTSNGGPLTTVIDTSGPFDGFASQLGINAAGTVAFSGGLDAGGSGIFTSSDGTVTAVVDPNDREAFAFTDTLVSINGKDTVVFRAMAVKPPSFPIEWTLQDVVFTDGGTASGSFVYDADLGEFDAYSNMSITTSGGSTFPEATFSVVTGGNASVFNALEANVADYTGHPLLLLGFTSPLTNAGGTVDVRGQELTCSDAECSSIDMPVRETVGGSVVATSIPAAMPEQPMSTASAGGIGIFVGDDPVADKVILEGDLLDGRIVTDVWITYHQALNDTGAIVFLAIFSDGSQGVYVASPNFVRTFNDVPTDHWAFTFIERLAESGITAGCGNDNYCPLSPVTRAQMAIFLERGMRGSDYGPPTPTGSVFNDVSADYWAAAFIEQFFLDGITAGCGNNNYCPDAEVTRDQMAVFLLRAKYGSGYSPPAASGVFDDVSLNHWAVYWIEQLAAEGITAGCGDGNYCPDAPVNRDQMAVFLVRTFGL